MVRNLEFNIDIKNKRYLHADAMQDDDILLTLNVDESGQAKDLTGSIIQLDYCKGDNSVVSITGSKYISIENNVVNIVCPRECTAAIGESRCNIVISSDDKQVSSFPISINVVANALMNKSVSQRNLATMLNELHEGNLEAQALVNWIKEHENILDIEKNIENLSSQIDEKANLLNARMDTFTTLSEGSTTADAELKDIRVGADGTTYENAGNAVREQFNELKEDLDDIKEPFAKSNEDAKDTLYVTDSEGNVICKIDKDGVHSVNFYNKDGVLINASGGGLTEEQAELLNSLSAKYNDGFYVTDADGNVVFKIDRDGVNAVGLTYAMSPYYGRKLLSLGDSLSAQTYMSNKSNTWQSQLAKMVGMVFDYSLNVNGDGTHQALAIGGTAILPTMENSIYLRAYDVKHYNDNGDGNSVIFVYAGQNDRIYPSGGSEKDGIVDENILGTIDDEPLSTETVISNMVTFYSRYKGMVEILMRENKKAKIVLVTLMKCRITLGDENTEETIKNIDTVRFAKVQAVREIADFYGLELVDLWSKSGVNHFNSDVFFRTDGDIQVHHNELGATKIAECSYATIM